MMRTEIEARAAGLQDLTGKRVVIVGGSSGIGAATAEAVCAAGGRVVVVGRSPGRLKQVADALKAGDAAYVVDITDEAAVQDFFQHLGPFDHLVVTAAELAYAPFLEIDLDAARRIVDSKLWGYIYCARYAAPYIAQDGSVVFFSGLAAWKPGIGAALVAAVNGAIVSLGRALAMELAPIRVNIVAPGVTDTPGWSHMSDGERHAFFDAVAGGLPVRRIGRPEDIARAVLFLLTNTYTTATTLHVDGGARSV